MSDTITVDQLTDAQLEEMLAKRKKAKEAKLEKERKEYEAQRDAFVNRMVTRALEIEQIIKQFKAECHEGMEEQFAKLEQYGKIPAKSKGGFSLTDTEGLLRITRTRQTAPQWDERALKGVSLVEEFMADTVKKRDKDTYELLLKFMKRNENGHLEYSKVFSLIQEEHRFSDPRWLEGLRLIKEGYSNHLRAYGYEIKTHTSTDGWQMVPLNFSSL